MWTGDNLDIMRGMNSACVDLIYLDPPFNSNADYAAPIGSEAAGAAFRDTWGLDNLKLVWHVEIKYHYPQLYSLLSAVQQLHGKSMMAYLIYMARRIMEMKRLLKDTGSIYLHCDPTASHYLKLLMDGIFDQRRFRGEIVWATSDSSGFKSQAQNWVRGHDTLLYYTKGEKPVFNKQYRPRAKQSVRGYNKTDDDGRAYKIYKRRGGGERRVYLDANPGVSMSNVWSDIPSFQTATGRTEYVNYPTQKPVDLLKRIIAASSNEGDMVLDPFCGCATACIAAEELQREWAGIDISSHAAKLVKERMKKELKLFYNGAIRKDIPQRTDLGKVLKYNDARNKRHLYGEQGGHCNGCGGHFELRNLTVDHIVPKSKGGTDLMENLQLLCGACNSMKGTRSHEELLALLSDRSWVKRKVAA